MPSRTNSTPVCATTDRGSVRRELGAGFQRRPVLRYGDQHLLAGQRAYGVRPGDWRVERGLCHRPRPHGEQQTDHGRGDSKREHSARRGGGDGVRHQCPGSAGGDRPQCEDWSRRTNVSLTFSNQLYVDNRMFTSSDLAVWTHQELGIETASRVTRHDPYRRPAHRASSITSRRFDMPALSFRPVRLPIEP